MDTLPHYVPNINPYAIYALIDPRDYTVRYIGISNNVYVRFMQHVQCKGDNLAKDEWITDLKRENVMLIMKVLESVETIEQAREREKHWIHHYLFLGAHLYNQSVPTIRISSTPKKVKKACDKSVDTGEAPKRQSGGYDYVRTVILHFYSKGQWPDDVSSDMKKYYTFYYFTPPHKKRDAARYTRHLKTYERGRKWIAEYGQSQQQVLLVPAHRDIPSV